ncbi:response regulator transcription factor [Streptomyces sp. TLI_185]|uniref:LuxR C-terminal-related transcriptional regulator n=1 Tax=Streptomyces sp. TLI_185 TaxID=2485151 RepID=UPI000F4E0A0B|nr:response regulator transcription factor [Streptomyces sp. TLI_185]RPF39178.1 LuxR family two component transcriptional regulator [Streptomyces sp. TLI_185]
MKVVIADDSMLIRDGLARLLAEAGCEVVATADNTATLMRKLDSVVPDAVIVDIKMPPTYTDEGLVAAQQLRSRHPSMGVLVLSQYLEVHYAMRLISSAPEHLGYLLKERVADVALLVDGLRRVIEGECVIDPTIVTTLMRRPRDPSPLAGLTARELEVLALMAEGRSNAAIAAKLSMSPKTLEAHVRQILQKLNLHQSPDDHRRVLAVLKYLRAAH